MKQLLQLALGLLLATAAVAKETISIVFPFAPTHGITPVFYPMVEEANRLQNRYHFVFEPKPGGVGIIALNHMAAGPASRVAVITPEFVENAMEGKIKESNYQHVMGMGDMCMAVFNKHGNESQGFASLRGTGEMILGSPGWGNAAHLVGLEIGEKFGLAVRKVIFRSNNEALLNLAQDGGVTQVFNRIDAFDELKSKAKVQARILGVSCRQRIGSLPHVKTLREQGITAPNPWVIITSSQDMPGQVRSDIADILNRALMIIGEQRVWELSSLQPLVFSGTDVNEYYQQRAAIQRNLLRKYRSAIDTDRGSTQK